MKKAKFPPTSIRSAITLAVAGSQVFGCIEDVEVGVAPDHLRRDASPLAGQPRRLRGWPPSRRFGR